MIVGTEKIAILMPQSIRILFHSKPGLLGVDDVPINNDVLVQVDSEIVMTS